MMDAEAGPQKAYGGRRLQGGVAGGGRVWRREAAGGAGVGGCVCVCVGGGGV